MSTYQPRPEPVITQVMRDRMTAEAGVPLDFRPGTPESAITTGAGAVASQVEQGFRSVLDGVSVDTAAGDQLTAVARGEGVERRPATRSRYIVRPGQSPASIPAGARVQGGGLDGLAQWQVVEAVTVVSVSTPIIIEAIDAGPVTLPTSGPVTLAVVTTVPGLTTMVWQTGVDPAGQIGRARELDPELRVRVASGAVGLRGRVLALPWVVAALVETISPGTLRVTVAPAPVGADQIAELVEAVGPGLLGIVASGAQGPQNYIGPDGSTTAVRWEVGSTQAVNIAITVTGTADSVAVDAAIRAYVASLGIGETMVRQRVIAAALTVQGAVDVTTCLLDAGAANIVPAPTTILTVGTLVVS